MNVVLEAEMNYHADLELALAIKEEMQINLPNNQELKLQLLHSQEMVAKLRHQLTTAQAETQSVRKVAEDLASEVATLKAEKEKLKQNTAG
eukprot:CAMPEP_0196585300 /NCGR_PEP_ID=MMETSP1081-20130531/50164_1 /TAXON_ID=36882 /ORGANISM="Pyramimonas amylifera, Strain CCMP720" /LENGTH=90 /DNA_ID=CAMNT_0041906799 /DNA_START=225 /DNA_END=497 /DNA_ORIENTATION=+